MSALFCSDCYKRFHKENVKGRVPIRCPECREKKKEEWRKKMKHKNRSEH